MKNTSLYQRFSKLLSFSFLSLIYVLVFSFFGWIEHVQSSQEMYTESGDPNALAVETQGFISRKAISQNPDDHQSAVALPEIMTGKSVSGGDAGEKEKIKSTEISPIWQQLNALDHEDKKNAVIEIETGGIVSASQSETVQDAESSWNKGSFAQAIEEIRLLEETGVPLGIGISWKTPKTAYISQTMEADDPTWTKNVRIGNRANIKETHLDFDAETGNYFAVLKYQDGSNWYFSVNLSSNGRIWQETFTWYASYEIKDIVQLLPMIISG